MCVEDAEAGDLLAIDVPSVEIGAKLNIAGSGFLRAEFTRTAHQELRPLVDHLSGGLGFTRKQAYAP